jgi:transcriptional regulator with PAS, ATPase and Fis domain
VVVLNSAPLVDRENQFLGAVLVVRDITRVTTLERELKERYRFQNIIGKSHKMQAIYDLLESLTETNTTVLITGETGTGKELVAEALHYNSVGPVKSFVKVNCSALAENLLESELFGHVKGAFTGAIKEKIGRFQLADGGTIFLDEIGDLSPKLQIKLLRVLQEKTFEKVGDPEPITVELRVIAATNRDLRKKIQQGEFREDLYYRLKVVEIALPPLRDRDQDIPLLVDHFCEHFNETFHKHILGVSDTVLNLFMNYPWPGNVRELEHALEHAFVVCRGHRIEVEHVPQELRASTVPHVRLQKPLLPDEAETIRQALRKTGWNKAKAARLLGIPRRTFYRKIEKYHLSEPEEN